MVAEPGRWVRSSGSRFFWTVSDRESIVSECFSINGTLTERVRENVVDSGIRNSKDGDEKTGR